MDEPSPDPVAARLVHLTEGRARLRLARPLDGPALEALADALAGLPRIRRVLARPNTGSVIVEADAPALALRETLEGAAALRLLPPEPPVRVGRAAEAGLVRLDLAIRGETENALDYRSALALLLVAGALVQMARGQIASPASALVLAALSYLEPRK